MSETPQENSSAAAKTEPPSNRKLRALLVLLMVVLLGLVGGGWLWVRSSIYVSTDDAFVEAPVHTISARVSGQALQVAVADNQVVAAGQLLVLLDPAEYQAELDKAAALLAQARNQTSAEYAQVTEAKAIVRQAEAEQEQARLDQERGRALLAQEVIPRERLERLETAYRIAEQRRQQAQQTLRKAQALLGLAANGSLEARVAQRQAEWEQARLKLGYTRIEAPVAGQVTRKTAEVGNNLRPGQALLALVQLEQAWVVANFKETQLTHIRPGQRVRLEVDALSGREFTGEVDSIMAGTGAAFSLLPPENATGNYVKVVQRVPVKIRLDKDRDGLALLRLGMSVVPTVDTGRSVGAVLGELNPFD